MDNQDWKNRRGYHKVSGHVDRPPPTNKRRAMFLLMPTAVAVLFLGMLFGQEPNEGIASSSSSTGAVATVSSSEVYTVINNFVEDKWGQETIDKADLLATNLEGLAKQGDVPKAASTAAYLRLLISGTGHETADDTMLTDVASYLGDASNAPTLEIYRQALANSAAR